MGLRSRLSSLSEPVEEAPEVAPLTPMMGRFIDALESIQEANPTFGVFARKFANMARKKPIPDANLLESLGWAQAMINGIITGEVPPALTLAPDPEGGPDDEDSAQDLEAIHAALEAVADV